MIEHISRVDIMFGPQCAGKTTLARTLFSSHEYISLGAEVRRADKSNPDKQLADKLIEEAKEWPAELGLAFIKTSLIKSIACRRAILLDGYPRHIQEFNKLEEFLHNESLSTVSSFIEVTAEKQTLLDRYSKRESRNENLDFFELRYQQYLDLRSVMLDTARNRGMQYYKIDTTD